MIQIGDTTFNLSDPLTLAALGAGVLLLLITILLFAAIPRRDVKPIAKDLIARFGDLGGVASASVGQLSSVRGVSEKTAVEDLRALFDAYEGRADDLRRVALEPDTIPVMRSLFEASIEQIAELGLEARFPTARHRGSAAARWRRRRRSARGRCSYQVSLGSCAPRKHAACNRVQLFD